MTAVLMFTALPLTGAHAAPQYNFRHIDSSDGLSANNVKCIAHDRLGFMWFGTKNGLNRYDGSTMRVYECYDQDLQKTKIPYSG